MKRQLQVLLQRWQSKIKQLLCLSLKIHFLLYVFGIWVIVLFIQQTFSSAFCSLPNDFILIFTLASYWPSGLLRNLYAITGTVDFQFNLLVSTSKNNQIRCDGMQVCDIFVFQTLAFTHCSGPMGPLGYIFFLSLRERWERDLVSEQQI